MTTQTTPARELVALADRSEFDGNTGIYVRAKCDGKWGSHDIAELSGDSLLAWLRADGGCNALAENTLLTLFNHEQVAQQTRAATLPQGASDQDALSTGRWINADDVDRLVREIDVAINGAHAAPQASLCDIASQIVAGGARYPTLSPPAGDSFRGWAAWLRDRAINFDPYVQRPYAELLAQWLDSLAATTPPPADILIDDVPLSELQEGKEYYASLTPVQKIAHDLRNGTFVGAAPPPAELGKGDAS